MSDIYIQILVNSLASALVLSLVAIGFTYIFRVTRVLHLAHAGLYVAGAFVFWWVLTKTNNWFAAVTLAIGVTVGLIYLIEKAVYLPLSRSQTNQTISLIASLGVYVAIVNVLALLFGSENRSMNELVSGSFVLGSIILTRVQVIQILVGVAVISMFLIYLRLTKSHWALQSVADQKAISEVFGVNTERERLRVLVAGSVLASIAAMLKTMESGVEPYAGMSITLSAVVVTILVSRLSVFLAIAFATALTLIQSSVEWLLDAQWKNGITFLVLLLVILFRTEGIVSYNLRKDRE